MNETNEKQQNAVKRRLLWLRSKNEGLWRIAGISVAFIAVVLAACLVFVNSIARDSRAAVITELEDYAQAAQSTLITHIRGDFDTLNGVAACLSEMDHLNENGMAALVEQVNRTNAFTRMGYAGQDGLVDMYDLDGSVYPMDFSGEDFFKQALSGENAVQNACKDFYSERRIVRYAVPVERDGRVVGALVAIHYATVFSNVVDLGEWSGFGYANIVDEAGNLVIRANNEAIPEGASSVYDIGIFTQSERLVMEESMRENGSVFGYTALTGGRVTAVMLPLGFNDWHLLCSLSEEYAKAPFYNSASIIVVVLVCSLIMFLCLIALFLRMINRSQQELRRQAEENVAVIAQSGKSLLRYDVKTSVIHSLGGTNELFGLPGKVENYPQSAVDAGILAPESMGDFLRFYENMRLGIPSGSVNTRFRLRDGSLRWYHADYTLLPDEYGELTHSIISYYDNTDAMEKELAYELRRGELAALMESSSYYLEANLITGEVEATHGHGKNLASFEGTELNLYALVEWDSRNNLYPDDAAGFREFFNANRLISLHAMGVFTDSLEFRAVFSGALTWNRVTIQMARYPYSDDIKAYVVFHDTCEEHKQREQLMGLATVDSLTTLLNREATMREIETHLAGNGASGTHALFMIDIDNFKQVNDTLGHQAGDSVLSDLASAIRHCFRETDIVGRIGGDEFFVFMKNVSDAAAVTAKTRELLTELQYVCAADNRHIHLSGSVGIAVYHGTDKPAKNINQLYAEADAALYKAKAMGKNCFAFADELDAMAISPSALPTHGALALNLRGLLNNLGNGIEIFHGGPEGGLTPLFCNGSLLTLFGWTREEDFFRVCRDDAFVCAHPEDKEALLAAYAAAQGGLMPFQHAYRARVGNGGQYRWVTLLGNFVGYEDGGFDFYAIYSDAEQLMRDRAAREEKYTAFRSYNRFGAGEAATVFHLNLTTDSCCGQTGAYSLPENWEDGGAEAFLQQVCEQVDSPENAEKYRKAFTRRALIDRCRRGEASVSLTLPFLTEPGRMLWLKITAETAENPHTHEIEALLYFMDVDWETRLQFTMRRLVGTDYEFLGQIDVATGKLLTFGGTTKAEAALMQGGGTDYNENMPRFMEMLIRDDFYDDAVAALSLERIVQELASADSYSCTFPTKAVDGLGAGVRRWRCGYLSEHRRVIVMSRTDVTDTVSGEMDSLTGLNNQQGFFRRVRETLAARPNERFRIHRFDIDSFKLVNDNLGYARGDALLRDFGAALRRKAGAQEDVVFARLEADHFVSFRPESGPSPETLMQRLTGWLERYPLEYTVTAHLGVYRIEDAGMDVSAMCDRALLALKSVKGNFEKRVAYYDDSLRSALLEEQALVNEMGSALANGQFEVYFQPQFNYENGAFIGAEALVRWNHPRRGMIPPGEFIPLFERNSFITKLDEYVWDTSAAYLSKWAQEPGKYPPVPISVNISRMDIYHPQLVQTLTAIIKKHGVSPDMLKLEITETAYMQNPEQLIRVVGELQAEGFTIEMDDFGSGYSSLNTLKDVPVDILKLDMRFLAMGEDDQRGGNILSSVIRMAHWLKIPIIAEGVETEAQAEYLKSLGCVYMQGYHFARPMPAARFEELITNSAVGATDRYAGTDLTGVAAFWDPSEQTALLFNSFVGGAAILEYSRGNAEIVRANDKFYEQLGTTRERYLQKQLHTLDRFEGEHREAFEGMLLEAIRTGGESESVVQSLPMEHDGRLFYTHNRVRMLAQNGDSYLFYLATENITERKALEEELRVKTEALQLSISQMGKAVCSYDIERGVLTMPEEYAKKHGFAAVLRDEEHIPANTVLREDKQKYIDFYNSIKAGEPTASALLRVTRVEGAAAYSWEMLNSVTIFNDDGRPVRAMITCEDVTADMEREAEAVRNSIIIEHTGISVISYDVLADHMRFSSGMTGNQPLDLMDYLAEYLDSDKSRIHPDYKAFHRQQLERLIHSEPQSGSYDYIANNWNTGYRWSRLHYVSIGDDAGRVYRIVGQINDIQREKDDEALIARLAQSFELEASGYRFNATMAERVFTLLFGTDANERTVDRVLAVLGEYYDLSRAYIFEDNEEHTAANNTFEWCAPGVEPARDMLQNVSYEDDLNGEYHALFDENNLFYCPDVSLLPERTKRILEPQGVKSMLQCAIMSGGVFEGFIGFDECRENRAWTDEQVGTLQLVCRIMGAFLMKLRKQEQAGFSEDFKAALDNNASFIYIADPETYEVVYNNKVVRGIFGQSYEGKICYREFLKREEPCEICPMRLLAQTGKTANVEVLRPDGLLLLCQASPLHWGGRDLTMITCVDITGRNKPAE